MLISLSASDALAGSILKTMYNGSCDNLPLVPLESLVFRLDPRVLPLLGQQYEFFPSTCRCPPSVQEVENIVELNAHGGAKADEPEICGNLWAGSTSLFPAASMINHAQ